MPNEVNRDLASLSIELLEESSHNHPDNAPLWHCPDCWKRQMAIDLMKYMWQPFALPSAQAA